jgi:predicted DNA-binding transcriptional regulator AlpA
MQYGVALAVERTLQMQRGLEKQLLDEGVYLSINETATWLGVSRQTLHNWKKRGKLVPVTIVGVLRYRKSEVEALLESQASNYTQRLKDGPLITQAKLIFSMDDDE